MNTVFSTILSEINLANSIVITSHKGPDGDSIGCSIGLYNFLKKITKAEVTICHPDPAPTFLAWLPDADSIIDFETNPEAFSTKLENSDLIFCLDYNASSRMGDDIQPLLLGAKAKKIMIDHHMHPEDFCDVVYSDPEQCSTSQMIFELIDGTGQLALLDQQIGQALYLGIMTDTGSFRYPSVSSRTHEIVGQIIQCGVNHAHIHEAVYDSNTIDRLQLRSHILANNLELLKDFPVAILFATQADMDQFNYQKGDTEGLVNVALSVEGVKVAVFFSEQADKVKISFRSKGDYVVNELASSHFSGGGHKYASGGVSFLSLDETISNFKQVVPNFF